MTEQFGNSSDKDEQNTEGFNQSPSDNDGSNSGVDITPQDLAELRKRDTSAQAHILDLESDNKGLREEKSLLANELASSTTLEEVMTRMNADGSGQENVDPSRVAEIVDQRLQQKTTEQVRKSNWDTVVDKLTDTYGEFKHADVAIQAKAVELRMSPEEATELARTNPTVFYELFLPKQNSVAPQQSIASAASGNTNTSQLPENTSGVRDKAYYKNLLKTDKNKYWDVKTQAQMRRDVYGME